MQTFQPTLPARGATGIDFLDCRLLVYFNPRSPHGERPKRKHPRSLSLRFQPTLPARGATHEPRLLFPFFEFQPTLPARGATRSRYCAVPADFNISTHAPRTGSDGGCSTTKSRGLLFQPTLPARGATRMLPICSPVTRAFQPTLPARGATRRDVAFTIRNPRFQPTLPARGATLRFLPHFPLRPAFQPTLPARGATRRARTPALAPCISTHAPRTGSDIPPFGPTP